MHQIQLRPSVVYTIGVIKEGEVSEPVKPPQGLIVELDNDPDHCLAEDDDATPCIRMRQPCASCGGAVLGRLSLPELKKIVVMLEGAPL